MEFKFVKHLIYILKKIINLSNVQMRGENVSSAVFKKKLNGCNTLTYVWPCHLQNCHVFLWSKQLHLQLWMFLPSLPFSYRTSVSHLLVHNCSCSHRWATIQLHIFWKKKKKWWPGDNNIKSFLIYKYSW